MSQEGQTHIQDSSLAAKLTTWANEPSLQDLKTDFENAKPYHDGQQTKVNRWNDLLKVTGKAKPKTKKGHSQVQPKLVRRQAEWRYSALSEPFLSSDRLFQVKPVTFEDAKAATQNEKVLNYQFRTKLNRVKLIDDFVRCTVDEGTSVLRVGWKRSTVPVKQEVPVYTYYEMSSPEEAQAMQQALAQRDEDERHFKENAPPEIQAAVDYYDETGQATTARKTGTQVVTTQKILENKPTIEVLNLQNVYIDPSCGGDIDRAMFIALTFETCKADLVKEGKRYINLDKVDWENATPVTNPDHETNTPDTFNMKGTRKKVVAYEYWGFWDINSDDTLVPIVVTWIGNVIIRIEKNPFPDQKLPFVLVPYLPVKRDVYGEPDAELLEENQAILGAVFRGMIDLLGRSANGQQGFAKGMLDPLNRRRFENGDDYEFNPNLPPQQGHIEHKYPELPGSALQMANLMNQEAEALTGVKSFSGGLSGESYGDVAAGIKGALDAAAKREMGILRRLAKGMSEVGTKIVSMNEAFLSEEETIRITNDKFETIKREDLAGDFDLDVDISTAEIDNMKAQDLGFMLQTIGPNMDFGIVSMILADIADLKRMPELAERIRRYQPQPDPLDQELKQLQIEELKAKIQKLQSDATLAEAKAGVAQADKDNKTLDFVEQETGTKHARDMEKMRGQAEGNQDLEVTKALTKPIKEGEKAPDIEAAVGFNQLSKREPQDTVKTPPLPVDNSGQSADFGPGGVASSLNSGGDPTFDPSAVPPNPEPIA